jgi:hypothetical protein
MAGATLDAGVVRQPTQSAHDAPRCKVKSKRTGKACRTPAVCGYAFAGCMAPAVARRRGRGTAISGMGRTKDTLPMPCVTSTSLPVARALPITSNVRCPWTGRGIETDNAADMLHECPTCVAVASVRALKATFKPSESYCCHPSSSRRTVFPKTCQAQTGEHMNMQASPKT